jgi:C-terminal processing protease CtpA/Prc
MVEKAAAAMTFLEDTSAFILDLRANGGGEITGVDVILSYFVDRRIHTYDMLAKKPEDNIQYFTDAKVAGPRYAAEKPVFVLTSRSTFSAGEAMVDAMRTWRHAQVVGERTRGGSNAALPTKATDHFIVGVPFMKTVNVATGKNWNVVGVVPDVAVPAAKAQDVAYVMALEAIVNTTKSDPQREEVQALLERLKSKPQ